MSRSKKLPAYASLDEAEAAAGFDLAIPDAVDGCSEKQFRALDAEKSTEQRPVHPRCEPVPVEPGKAEHYDIALTPTANVFQKGHRLELVIRNQDDMLGKLSRSGVYLLPFMRTVTHTLKLENCYLTLPVTGE